MHVGWGEIKAAGPERPSPLSSDVVTFISLPTSSPPIDLGCSAARKDDSWKIYWSPQISHGRRERG